MSGRAAGRDSAAPVFCTLFLQGLGELVPQEQTPEATAELEGGKLAAEVGDEQAGVGMRSQRRAYVLHPHHPSYWQREGRGYPCLSSSSA